MVSGGMEARSPCPVVLMKAAFGLSGTDCAGGKHVGRALGQAPHQVVIPLAAEGRGGEHLVAAPDQLQLQVRADAVEHLELEAVAADPLTLREVDHPVDDALVVGGHRRVPLAPQRQLRQAQVVAVHVLLLRVRHRRRLEVGTLDQPQVTGLPVTGCAPGAPAPVVPGLEQEDVLGWGKFGHQGPHPGH